MHPSTFRVLLVLVLLATLTACSDDDDPGRPRTGADINGYVLQDGKPVPGAPVYLYRIPGLPPHIAPVLSDSTKANDDGLYEFDGLGLWIYYVYAEVVDDGKATRLVSPMKGPIDLDFTELPDKGAGEVADLVLTEVLENGTVTGDVWAQTEIAAPVDSADVELFRYTSGHIESRGRTLTKEDGTFEFAGVMTGNYTAFATKYFSIDAPFPVYTSGETEPFFCDGETEVMAPRLWLYEAMVEKPAVYIYPETPGPFSVTLGLANGSRIVASIPEYGDGWNVEVARGGRIDDTFDYLFYEVAISAWPLLEQGWCLERGELAAGLADIVAAFGLNAAESADFLDYWTTRLPRHDWYVVKPVVGDHLETWVGLDVVPAPDSVIRFWLFFEGSSGRVAITPPSMPRVARTGTTVVEWGGAVIPSRDF